MQQLRQSSRRMPEERATASAAARRAERAVGPSRRSWFGTPEQNVGRSPGARFGLHTVRPTPPHDTDHHHLARSASPRRRPRPRTALAERRTIRASCAPARRRSAAPRQRARPSRRQVQACRCSGRSESIRAPRGIAARAAARSAALGGTHSKWQAVRVNLETFSIADGWAVLRADEFLDNFPRAHADHFNSMSRRDVPGQSDHRRACRSP